MFQSYDNSIKSMPPKQLLMRVLDRKCKIYVFLWERKNDQFLVELDWKEVRKFFNKNTFITGLRELGNKGVLFFEEKEDSVFIELMSWVDTDE
jgi:hypothetical protein